MKEVLLNPDGTLNILDTTKTYMLLLADGMHKSYYLNIFNKLRNSYCFSSFKISLSGKLEIPENGFTAFYNKYLQYSVYNALTIYNDPDLASDPDFNMSIILVYEFDSIQEFISFMQTKEGCL